MTVFPRAQSVGRRDKIVALWAARVIEFMWSYRASLALGLGVAAILALVPQAREIYRAAAGLETRTTAGFLPALLAMAVAALCTFDSVHRAAARSRKRGKHLVLTRIISAFVSTLPLLGLIVGIFWASSELATPAFDGPFPDDDDVGSTTAEPTGWLVALLLKSQSATTTLLVLAVLATLATLCLQFAFSRRIERRPSPTTTRILAALVFIFGVIALSDDGIATGAGSVGVFVAFYFPVTIAGVGLTSYSSRIRLPVTALLIVAISIVLVLNKPGNHRVTLSPGDAELTSLDVAFDEWLATRPDKDVYQKAGRPYPVFLIGASGGGIYAARFSAMILAGIQDRCPHFAQHIFAISSVSGGSIGSSVFASLAGALAKPEADATCDDIGKSTDFVDATARFFDGELLAPLIGRMLFRDSLQALIPLSLGTDRASAWERALSKSWSAAMPDHPDPWNKPYLSTWRADGLTPALLLNSTAIDDGSRVVSSPFRPFGIDGEYPVTGLIELPILANGRCDPLDEGYIASPDVSLATAVGISSRFPWFMPVAEVGVCGGSLVRLVDGGYADNSGMETVRNTYEGLRIPDFGQDDDVSLHVLSIRDKKRIKETNTSSGFIDFLTSPASALLGYMGRRPDTAARWFENRYHTCYIATSETACGGGLSYSEFLLNLAAFDLPLGFSLAPSTEAIIDVQTGKPKAGWGPENDPRWQQFVDYVEYGNVGAEVIHALTRPYISDRAKGGFLIERGVKLPFSASRQSVRPWQGD